MQFNDVSIPEIYKESSDFRVLLKWFAECLTRIKFDTENLFDLYDALRCPEDLLWMLADTIGYKYDTRLPPAFNRLVILYFMSMIRNRGSKDGVTLAAETNLAQFNIIQEAKGYKDEYDTIHPPKPILYNRLENTSIPVNSVYVTPHTEDGYIEVVYFSTKLPVDACIEYVRPLGMYLFQFAGVRFDARTKVSVDARLTNIEDLGISIGSTHVGHYRREDYARLQKMENESEQLVDTTHTRHPVYYRNSEYEKDPNPNINPGYRSLYSLQMSNNEQIVKSLIDPIFSLGYGPQSENQTYDTRKYITGPDDVEVHNPGYYLDPLYKDKPVWNLRYDRDLEIEIDHGEAYTIDDDRSPSVIHPRPAVNPVATKLGDAIAMNSNNTIFTKVDESNNFTFENENGDPVDYPSGGDFEEDNVDEP